MIIIFLLLIFLNVSVSGMEELEVNPFSCSQASKNLRKDRIYSHLSLKDFCTLVQVNHVLRNEIGDVCCADFGKLKKHFNDASFSGYKCSDDFNNRCKTVHVCCMSVPPIIGSFKRMIPDFVEKLIAPKVWSDQTCFVGNVWSGRRQRDDKLLAINPYEYNHIDLVSGGVDNITTIFLDTDENKEACISRYGDLEGDQSKYTRTIAKENLALILYAIDHLEQSLDSLDQYICPEERNDTPVIILLSKDLQNNEQIRKKIRDKVDKCGKKIVKRSTTDEPYYSCDSCRDEPLLILMHADLFPEWMLERASGDIKKETERAIERNNWYQEIKRRSHSLSEEVEELENNPFSCSQASKNLRKDEIYSHLSLQDFRILARVNHVLRDEIGDVRCADFGKLKKHFNDASFSGYRCSGDFNDRYKTVHVCCMSIPPIIGSFKRMIPDFVEKLIAPKVWSDQNCFLGEIWEPYRSCYSKVLQICPYEYNHIDLVSSGVDNITTIFLDTDENKEACISRYGDFKGDQSKYRRTITKENLILILYAIDHTDQSLDSLDQYICPEKRNNTPVIILLSKDLQNNEQIRKKIRDRVNTCDKKVVRRLTTDEPYYSPYYSCDSCKNEPLLTLIRADLFPDFISSADLISVPQQLQDALHKKDGSEVIGQSELSNEMVPDSTEVTIMPQTIELKDQVPQQLQDTLNKKDGSEVIGQSELSNEMVPDSTEITIMSETIELKDQVPQRSIKIKSILQNKKWIFFAILLFTFMGINNSSIYHLLL